MSGLPRHGESKSFFPESCKGKTPNSVEITFEGWYSNGNLQKIGVVGSLDTVATPGFIRGSQVLPETPKVFTNGNCTATYTFHIAFKEDGVTIKTATMQEQFNTKLVEPIDDITSLVPTLNAESNPTTASPSSATNSGAAATGSNSEGQTGRKGLNSGPVAGIAIGVLLLGLGLGFLVAFLLLKRKYARRNIHAAVPIITPSHQAYPTPPPDTLQLNQFLLDATPDREIATEIRSLKDLIQQHVENNYHQQPIQANPTALAQVLAELGVGQQGTLNPDTVASLALNPPTRYAALQHILSEVLFRSIDFKAASNLSMLPAPVAAFASSVPPVERKVGDDEATSLAMTKWRALTAFLLHPARSQRTALTPNESVIAPQIQALASSLNQFLEPFVIPDHNSRFQQMSHLHAIILEFTKLGYVILSQPGEWAFVHRPVEGGNCLVTCAGVQKVRNKDGVGYGGAGQIVEMPTMVPL